MVSCVLNEGKLSKSNQKQLSELELRMLIRAKNLKNVKKELFISEPNDFLGNFYDINEIKTVESLRPT